MVPIVSQLNISYQYYQLKSHQFYQMTTMLSDNASIHNLSTLRQQLALMKNRVSSSIEQSQIRQMGQLYLIEINGKLNNENQVIKNMAFKWDDFISSWIQIKNQYEEEINQMNEQIDQKSIEIDNLQEIVSHFQKKMDSYEQKYETLKSQLSISNQNTMKTFNEFAKYKQVSKESEKRLIDKIQQYKYTISTLTNQKQILLDQIKNQINQQLDSKQTIQQLQMQIESYQKQSKLSILKYQELLKRSQHLQRLLDQKINTINTLANQIGLKRIQELRKCSNISLDMSKIKLNSKETQRNQTLQRMSHRSFIFQLNKNDYHSSFFQLNSNISMDPYFTHFVLTSQSVKIKQECEQLLNIDAKPFYTEIVQKRIPMHIWDQWIRNKLRQVLKQQKVTCESGQSSEG